MPPELAARFDELDRRELVSAVWRLGRVVGAVARQNGGSFDVPLDSVLDPALEGALVDMCPVDDVLRVTVEER